MARKKKISGKTDAQTQEQTNRDRVQDIVKAYKSFFDVTETLRRQMKEDLDFVVGGVKQWKDADFRQLEKEQRPCLTFNLTQPAVNYICGIQEQKETDYRYFPRGSEDETLGRNLTSQVKYVMDRCGGVHEEAQQFRMGVTIGPSVLEVGHSYNWTDDLIEGDITMTRLAMNSWACDTLTRRYDKCDARWQQKLMWYSREQAEKAWPEFKDVLYTEDWFPYDPQTTGVGDHLLRELYDKERDRIRILQHWYQVPVKATLLVNKAEMDPSKAVQRFKDGKDAEAYIQEQSDQAGAQAQSQFQLFQTDKLYTILNKTTGQTMGVGDANQADTFMETVKDQAGRQVASQFEVLDKEATALRVSHLTGWTILDDKPSPYDDDWRYPFSFYCPFGDGESFDDWKGVVRDLKDPQREVNWHHSTALDTLNRGPKGAWFFDAAGNPDLEDLKKRLSKAGFVGTFNGAPPQFIPPSSFSPGDLAMMEIARDFVSTSSGVQQSMMGADTATTRSGRAQIASQSGGMVALAHLFANWQRTKQYTGMLLAKRVQQFHSPEKMDRIIGQEFKVMQLLGVPMQAMVPPEVRYANYRKIQDLDFDVVVGFQDASATARQAQFNQLMQLAAIGFPVPPPLMIEMTDTPFKDELLAAFMKQGMQSPNEALAKVLGAGQGQGSATGVNIHK